MPKSTLSKKMEVSAELVFSASEITQQINKINKLKNKHKQKQLKLQWRYNNPRRPRRVSSMQCNITWKIKVQHVNTETQTHYLVFRLFRKLWDWWFLLETRDTTCKLYVLLSTAYSAFIISNVMVIQRKCKLYCRLMSTKERLKALITLLPSNTV